MHLRRLSCCNIWFYIILFCVELNVFGGSSLAWADWGGLGRVPASLFPLDAGRRTCLGSPRSLGSVETLILILGLLLTRLQYLERDPELFNMIIDVVLILSIIYPLNKSDHAS